MKFTIEIPDEELTQEIKRVIAEKFARESFAAYEKRELKRMYREVIKEMIYEPTLKAEIINSTINQAASQIRVKAVPILAQKLMDDAAKEG
ncbi:MAG: hypothetical protein ACI4EA_08100 [Candidatus Ornithomonoglobus sp.]